MARFFRSLEISADPIKQLQHLATILTAVGIRPKIH
jgi:hypothetical protein